MVMFKARFQPDRPQAHAEARSQPSRGGSRGLLQRQQQQQPQRQQQQQQQPQPQPQPPSEAPPSEAPPIEKERGPQYPVKEPGPGNPPERVS